MNQTTVRQLTALNLEFYQHIGQSFDQTRQQSWAGWDYLHSLLATVEVPDFLDIACGNGRFLSFLHRHLEDGDFTYLGIDSDEYLLQQARAKCLPQHAATESFQQVDIFEILNQDKRFSDQAFSFIVCFGFIHHVPSTNMRTKLLQLIASNLGSGGTAIISAWQFDRMPHFAEKQLDPAVAVPGLDVTQLETGDYFLGWKETSAARYCHLVTEEEMFEAARAANLTIIDQYPADGQLENLNQYYVLQPSTV